MSERERIARLVLKLHAGLLVVLVGGAIRWIGADVTGPRIALALLVLVPALLPLHGLWTRNRRTYAWGTLCLIPYIVLGITELIANPQARSWATGCLLLSFGTFIALIAYLRVSRPAGSGG
jgi:uncharacterized membrane protein